MSKNSTKQTLRYKSLTMGNLLPSLPLVILQVFESLIKYRTKDFKWEYRKEGF